MILIVEIKSSKLCSTKTDTAINTAITASNTASIKLSILIPQNNNKSCYVEQKNHNNKN